MSEVIRFNLSEAQDAQARLDDGEGREGDDALAEVLDGFHRQEYGKYQDAVYEASLRPEPVEGECPDDWHFTEGDGVYECPTCGETDPLMEVES